MSLAESKSAATKEGAAPPRAIHPLQNGDRLTRVEFERRWEATPGLKRAELIEGIVYVPATIRGDICYAPATLREDQHGEPLFRLLGWLWTYHSHTPGIIGSIHASTRVDNDNMPQPDAYFRLPPQLGSTARLEDGYIAGAPDLIVEVSASSVSIDMHLKFDLYRRSGVREYIVWRVLDEQLDWFVLREGNYEPLSPDAEGWLKSPLFPGLWLQPQVLLYGLPSAIYTMAHAGLASPEHQAFVEKLTDATKPA
jgi:Uma2 family endonuclease